MSGEYPTLEAFIDAVEVLSPGEAEAIRARYRLAFVDEAKAALNGGALTPRGIEEASYEAYLWDYFSEPVVVSEREALAAIERAPSDVYVMWDLHADDRVAIPDYFRFSLGTVLRGKPSRLLVGQRWLPEDLYVFDDSMAWTVALTHEWIDDARYCLRGDRAAGLQRSQP